jgi:hypothetical protein
MPLQELVDRAVCPMCGRRAVSITRAQRSGRSVPSACARSNNGQRVMFRQSEKYRQDDAAGSQASPSSANRPGTRRAQAKALGPGRPALKVLHLNSLPARSGLAVRRQIATEPGVHERGADIGIVLNEVTVGQSHALLQWAEGGDFGIDVQELEELPAFLNGIDA